MSMEWIAVTAGYALVGIGYDLGVRGAMMGSYRMTKNALHELELDDEYDVDLQRAVWWSPLICVALWPLFVMSDIIGATKSAGER